MVVVLKGKLELSRASPGTPRESAWLGLVMFLVRTAVETHFLRILRALAVVKVSGSSHRRVRNARVVTAAACLLQLQRELMGCAESEDAS